MGGEEMNNRLTEFSEQRRANRLPWERPVRITRPIQIAGRSVNASANGLLVRVERGFALSKGDLIALEIPRADGAMTATRQGRVARMEYTDSDLLLGLELV
jgi:acetyl/propionyl-CoA carboxylase alpha subunit